MACSPRPRRSTARAATLHGAALHSARIRKCAERRRRTDGRRVQTLEAPRISSWTSDRPSGTAGSQGASAVPRVGARRRRRAAPQLDRRNRRPAARAEVLLAHDAPRLLHRAPTARPVHPIRVLTRDVRARAGVDVAPPDAPGDQREDSARRRDGRDRGARGHGRLGAEVDGRPARRDPARGSAPPRSVPALCQGQGLPPTRFRRAHPPGWTGTRCGDDLRLGKTRRHLCGELFTAEAPPGVGWRSTTRRPARWWRR